MIYKTRKFIFPIIILSLLLCLVNINSTTASLDWHSAKHSYRFYVDFNGSQLSGDIADYPVYLNLSGIDEYWDNRGDDTGAQLNIYGYSVGTSTWNALYYENVKFDAGTETYLIFFRVPIAYNQEASFDDYKNRFIIYINCEDATTFESKANVWYNAVHINHMETQANLRTSDNVTVGTNPWYISDGKEYNGYYLSSTTGIIGGGYTGFSSSGLGYGLGGYFNIGQTPTIMIWAQPTSTTGNRGLMAGYGSSDQQWGATMYFPNGGYNLYGRIQINNGGDGIVKDATVSGSSSLNAYAITTNKMYVNGVGTGLTNKSGLYIYGTPAEYFIGYATNYTSLGATAVVDEFWAFSDTKSDDWIKACAINVNDYSNIITVSEYYDAPPTNIPLFTNPTNSSTVNLLQVEFNWSSVDGAEGYQLKYADNVFFEDYNISNFVTTTASYYLANGDWYADIRTKFGEDNYSDWYSEWTGIFKFTKDDTTEITEPTGIVYSHNIYFEWNDILDGTGYDIYVYHDEGLTDLAYSTSSANNFVTINDVDEGNYSVIVRAKDSYYTGDWSEAQNFEVSHDIAVDFTYSGRPTLYQGELFTYILADLDTELTYTFNINEISNTGAYVQTIATKVVTPDVGGDGNFTYTFTDEYCPFAIEYDLLGVTLSKHYVAPVPTRMYAEENHRDINDTYGDYVISIGIGDIVYNDKTGMLHDAYQPDQSLYTYGDYILVHYSIPIPTETDSIITIFDMNTSIPILYIESDDLQIYNPDVYRGFLVMSTNGAIPAIVDEFTCEFTGDNWQLATFNKGVYDYMLAKYGTVSLGESVFIVSDSPIYEWKSVNSKSSLKEGQTQTWTITCNTNEVWDTYHNIYFKDNSSGTYKIGSAVNIPEPYPATYAETFVISYQVNMDEDTDGGGRFRVGPMQYSNFIVSEPTINYSYIIDKSFTITEVTDSTSYIGDIFDLFGLGTVTGKLIASLGVIAIALGALAIFGVPLVGIGIVVIALYIIFVALGFIPLWTVIIIGLAIALLLIRMFLLGGGSDE